jgi:radical SAM protein with 4Fe4S-binding SPASM domain
VITKSQKDSIYKVIDLAKKYNVDKILMSHLLPQNKKQTEDIFYTRDYNHEGHEYMKLVSKYAIYTSSVMISFPFMEIKTERFCQFVENDFTYVDYSGNVIPCYRFANTYSEWVFDREKTVLKHSFGNVKDLKLNEIYYSEEYIDFRQSVLNTKHPSCVDCEYEDACSFIETTEYDCLSYSPSCADCLWNRNIIKCT